MISSKQKKILAFPYSKYDALICDGAVQEFNGRGRLSGCGRIRRMSDYLYSPAELAMQSESFRRWATAENGTNEEELKRLKRMLPVALRDCITDTQRKYLIHYFGDEMSMVQIAQMYGVNKSTISRTINRALDKLYKYLRFTSPKYAEQTVKDSFRIDQKRGYKTNRLH